MVPLSPCLRLSKCGWAVDPILLPWIKQFAAGFQFPWRWLRLADLFSCPPATINPCLPCSSTLTRDRHTTLYEERNASCSHELAIHLRGAAIALLTSLRLHANASIADQDHEPRSSSSSLNSTQMAQRDVLRAVSCSIANNTSCRMKQFRIKTQSISCMHHCMLLIPLRARLRLSPIVGE